MSDLVGEQSRVHIMPISAKWKHKSSIHIGFIVFNGGVTTFFAKSVEKKDKFDNGVSQLIKYPHNEPKHRLWHFSHIFSDFYNLMKLDHWVCCSV